MKKLLLIIIFVVSVNCLIAQEKAKILHKIDSIEKINLKLETEILRNKNIISKLKDDILSLNTAGINKVKINLTRGVFLVDEAFVLGKKLAKLQKGEEVLVCGYEDDFWIVEYEDKKGYILNAAIPRDPKLDVIKRKSLLAQHKYEEAEMVETVRLEMDKLEKEKADRRKRILDKYGSEVGEKILNGFIWIGMTSSMVIDSRGRPKDNNKSVGSWGVHEQWIYDNNVYLYIKNGKLSSWQE